MKKVFLIVAAVATMLATGFTACKSNSPQPPEPPKEVDIYVAGYDNSGAKYVAKVWKNGEELYKLANSGIIMSIVVYNGDIYAAGFEVEDTNRVAKVWKNGKELYKLADKGGATSIFIAERK